VRCDHIGTLTSCGALLLDPLALDADIAKNECDLSQRLTHKATASRVHATLLPL
jgi:hypothetical protein